MSNERSASTPTASPMQGDRKEHRTEQMYLQPEQMYLQGYQDAMAQREADDWARVSVCAGQLSMLLDRIDGLEPIPHLTESEAARVFDAETTR